MVALVRRLVHGWVDTWLRFNVIDRSLAIGAQAFGAVIPLFIVLEAVEPGERSIADSLIDRLDLTGEAADSVRAAFAVTGTSTTTFGVIGTVVLVFSALSFCRRLQHVYEDAWGVEARGYRASGWALIWLALLVAYIFVQPTVKDVVEGQARVVVTLAGVLVFGLATPYLLLSRRVPARDLWLQSVLTAVGSTALGVWTAVYMPHAIATSASQFGAIGVAFALLTWLWGVGLVLTCAAVYGARGGEAILRPSS